MKNERGTNVKKVYKIKKQRNKKVIKYIALNFFPFHEISLSYL